MGNFYTDVISKDIRFQTTNRVDDLALLEPKTRALVQAIIAKSSVMLMVFETFRSEARQVALFNQGASTLKQVGVHHYGLACDLVKDINGEPSWKGSFDFLGELAHSNGMIWGGDWGDPSIKHSFIDADHVQRITIARQDGLFKGAWYPDDSYDPYHDH
jgi:hypothetical protein